MDRSSDDPMKKVRFEAEPRLELDDLIHATNADAHKRGQR